MLQSLQAIPKCFNTIFLVLSSLQWQFRMDYIVISLQTGGSEDVGIIEHMFAQYFHVLGTVGSAYV